ncbi:MAG: hypothetical protein Q9221_006413 [Calogaya cf. arnoldii]
MSSSECARSSSSPLDSNDHTQSSSTSTREIENIKEEIYNYLEAIGDGFFATSGLLPMAVNPGLSLKGLGKVGLPLTERDARDIVNISREAPFGKGDQKLVDQSVRKTWEIDSTQVEFRNPQWSKTLQYAISKTVEQLGALGGESSVRPDLHKVLLYEEGGFFKTHRDTEKAPGMFATLVIMLPSEHEGGEVVVRLGKEKRTLSNPESNEFDYAYLDKARPPSVLEDRNSVIDSALTSWKKLLEEDDEASEELVYLFDHQYSEANFGLDFLKGEDQGRGLHLRDACSKHGFNLFLAHFEHSERSKDDVYDDDDESDEWTLTKLFTPDGVCVAMDMEIEKQAIIQDNPFDGDSPDHEESEGWLGNEDAKCTEFYRRSCLVIVPEEKYSSFLNRAGTLRTAHWTTSLLSRMYHNMQAEAAKAELLKVCSLATGLCFASPFLENSYSDLFSLAASISALPRLAMRLGSSTIFDREYQKAIALHDNSDSTSEKRSQKVEQIGKCMSEALVRKPNDGDLQVADGDNDNLLLKARAQGDAFVVDIILPICKLVIRNMDFVADTISKLYETTNNSRLSRSIVPGFARDIVIALAQEMSEHCVSKSGKESKTDHFQPIRSMHPMHTVSQPFYNPDLYKTSMSWKAITKLFCHCENLGVVDGVPVLTKVLLEITQASAVIDLTLFLMPLIKSLSSELPENLGTHSHHQELFKQVIYRYIEDYVGSKPSPPHNLTREDNRDKCYADRGFYADPNEWYNCKECKALNEFLAAPDRSEWRYKIAEPGRKHLDRRLYNLDCISFTDKSYRDALKQWERRCAEAKSGIEGIGHEKLRKFLGGLQYHSIMKHLFGVTSGQIMSDGQIWSAGRQPLAPLVGSVQNNKRARDGVEDGPTEKRARQVEIIDLC